MPGRPLPPAWRPRSPLHPAAASGCQQACLGSLWPSCAKLHAALLQAWLVLPNHPAPPVPGQPQSQLQTGAYLLAYFGVLALRYR